MEWVETTGKTVEEATALALDQLGVIEDEADIEVLEEPRQGMFGRVRGSARVRARIRPTAPPAKSERGRKAKKRSGGAESAKGRSPKSGGAGSRSEGDSGRKTSGRDASGEQAGGERSGSARAGKDEGSTSGGGRSKRSQKADREPMPEQEQREVGEEFLSGLLDSMGLSGTLSSSLDSDGILLFEIEGDQLGLLMGPGLNTLDAIQEICRNVIQRRADGREYGKVVVDVSSARRDRTEALEEFVRSEAQRVTESGEDVIFEVMSRADRKVVHDVVADLEGVATESVGEDPRRRVVLRST